MIILIFFPNSNIEYLFKIFNKSVIHFFAYAVIVDCLRFLFFFLCKGHFAFCEEHISEIEVIPPFVLVDYINIVFK